MSGGADTHRRHRLPGAILAAVLIGAAGLTLWHYRQQAARNVLSESAVLSTDVVNIAALVAGRVAEIHVAENQRVEKGDLLFAIEPETYRLIAAQARADLKLAEASRDAQRRTIAAEQSNAAVARRQITRAEANLALAESTLARLSPLAAQGYVSAQQIDDARTARDDARTSLDQATDQAAAADVLISTLDASEALVEARRVALAIAERNLADTQVFAPHDGFVVGLSVAAGQVVAPSQALFTLIDAGNWHAAAIFPETELAGIEIGNCARVHVLADPGRTLSGRVTGIGWGVTSETVVNLPFSMPYVPKTLEWVRIVQRFPVRVALTDPPGDLMRIGASADVVINGGSHCDEAP